MCVLGRGDGAEAERRYLRVLEACALAEVRRRTEICLCNVRSRHEILRRRDGGGI
jgi:ABC-type transport system involved in cytochrome bd biosynthesis fused ATPase/permease subunit